MKPARTRFPACSLGSYRLRASLPGFQTATRENIQLSQGQQVRFNFTLQVGTVATAVEVLARLGDRSGDDDCFCRRRASRH